METEIREVIKKLKKSRLSPVELITGKIYVKLVKRVSFNKPFSVFYTLDGEILFEYIKHTHSFYYHYHKVWDMLKGLGSDVDGIKQALKDNLLILDIDNKQVSIKSYAQTTVWKKTELLNI